MAKKKEKEEQEKKTFAWTSFGDSVPFALDYSAKELQERWKINRGFITAFITKFPSFEDFFLRMRYTEGAMIKGDTYKMKGVPAELEPFFRFYIEEAQKNQWHFIKGKEKFPLTIDEENLADFEKFFCRELYKKATEAEHDQTIPGLKQENIQQTTKEPKAKEYIADSTISVKEPSNLYWYRRLFNNRAFQKEISLDYWKKEYSYRCDLVRDLSLQLPYDAQIRQLQKAICSMDTQIAAMLHIIEISNNKKERKNQEKRTGFLETFPTELLKELRTTIINPNAGNTRVVYSVDNIDVSAVIAGKQEKHKLEKFFDRIKKIMINRWRRDRQFVHIICVMFVKYQRSRNSKLHARPYSNI